LLAGSEFIVRGPVRAMLTSTGFNDFLSPYIQSQAWRCGLDPYSPEVLLQLWPAGASHFVFLRNEVANGTLVERRGIPTAYPLTALVLLSPFSLIPWKAAYTAWMAFNLALFGLMVGTMVELAGLRHSEPKAILLMAATLALAPFQTGIATGNSTLAAVELGVIAVYAARQRYEMVSAVLIALSAGLKPQIGICFLFYYMIRPRMRVFVAAAALLLVVGLAGWLRLEAGHTPWWTNYRNDNRMLLESGVLGNFTEINQTRFGLINLQVALYPMLADVRRTNVLAAAIATALLAAWLIIALRRRRSPDSELLELSAPAVISLLPIYHRFYDAALLVLPLVWTFVCFGRGRERARERSRRFAVAGLLLMLPFLIPGGTLLEALQDRGSLPLGLTSHWWWQGLVMPHEVWLLLLLSGLLLYEMALPGARGVQEPAHSAAKSD